MGKVEEYISYNFRTQAGGKPVGDSTRDHAHTHASRWENGSDPLSISRSTWSFLLPSRAHRVDTQRSSTLASSYLILIRANTNFNRHVPVHLVSWKKDAVRIGQYKSFGMEICRLAAGE
jgi:hypothetical protein